jgi:hypothetical protein
LVTLKPAVRDVPSASEFLSAAHMFKPLDSTDNNRLWDAPCWR